MVGGRLPPQRPHHVPARGRGQDDQPQVIYIHKSLHNCIEAIEAICSFSGARRGFRNRFGAR